ncbi:MAG: Gfo/Idh/MocA family oxidoreductase, partial [Candidatus Poribacteria bacterium]|nr:Gfo/Idh/MocA family oxidoreductase [Candidatus Poribacteria bacterium]
MADVLYVAVIGTGGIAQSHLNAISQLDTIRVVAVMDVDASRAERAAAQHDARAYTDFDAALNHPDVQAVHICTPHAFHADQSVAAANAGKHVLVEKPMALSVADCDRMIAASESAGKTLMVGQVLRHYPINRAVKAIIAEGKIGKVGHLIRRRYSYFDPGVEGARYPGWYRDVKIGGICVLYCFGPHEYDILPWYMDSPVVEVFARGTESTELYKGQMDTYTAIMTHANGAESVLTQTVVSHTGAGDQFIVGSEGSLSFTNSQLTMNGQSVAVEGSSSDGMRLQIQEFADCCLNGGVPDASGLSVRHSMAVIEAAMLSADRR